MSDLGVDRCTMCGACAASCPAKIAIPDCLARVRDGASTTAAILADLRAESCIGCHGCEKRCPQKIKIIRALEELILSTK